jgi:biopolymer transport protein TolQ
MTHSFSFKKLFAVIISMTLFVGIAGLAGSSGIAMAKDKVEVASASGQGGSSKAVESVSESDVSDGTSIFSRAMRGGPVVFLVLLTLVGMSVVTWGALVAKWWHFKKVSKSSDAFVKSFWDSRSLNDLNSRLQEYPYSPAREIFRSGYAELVRGSQLREHSPSGELAVGAAMENLGRALTKAKMFERRRMERFQSLLATSASASPFIGLFGTVWGIMGAFEGIAQTGSASLAAVAPGISEALIATAFGLAAAIPAVVGFNFFNSLIRAQLVNLDGFCADFLNIVERYLVTDKKPGQAHHV